MVAGVNPLDKVEVSNKAVKLGIIATPNISSPTSYSHSVLAYVPAHDSASAYEMGGESI